MKSFTKSSFFVFFLALIFILGVVFFSRKNQEKPLQKSSHFVLSPMANFFSGMGYWFSDKFSFLGSIAQLKNENEELVQENLVLKSQLAQLKDVKKENDILREQLNLARRDQYNLEAALVVGTDLLGQSDRIYINKGGKDGLRENMAVVVGEGVLVGKIVQVFENDSAVELVFSRESRINAEIEESGEKGIVKGEYGTAAILDGIPQTVELKPGDTVITSGLGSTFPRGLLIGYIKDTVPTADQLFQKSSLVLPMQSRQLRLVWVIK